MGVGVQRDGHARVPEQLGNDLGVNTLVKSSVAQVCLRSWNLVSGSPAWVRENRAVKAQPPFVPCHPHRSPPRMPREALSQLAWAHALETLLWASKGKGARHTFNYDLINSPDPASQVSSVWHIPAVPMREKSHGYHPTQKPLRLLRRAVLASTREGALLFDPFCGSGTTGVAAKELGRFFVGAEVEREYAELAERRIGV